MTDTATKDEEQPSNTASYPMTNPDPPEGHPGNLSPEHKKAMEQLRDRLTSNGYTERLDDPSMLRFLRARKYKVADAYEMFVSCEKWRKEFGVDELVRTFKFTEKEAVSKYYPQYYHKTDKDGRPVYIEQLGKVDLTAMYKITTEERLLQNLVYEYERFANERLPACSRSANKLLETSCTIMDLKGVGVSSVRSVYTYVSKASHIGQNYYPERMGKFYIINAPFGFATAFKLIKSFLDPVTVEKIFILASDYQKMLLPQIPAENLPVEFGGTCKCPEGCQMSDAGVWNDEGGKVAK